jgi:hypothetical protein
MAMESRPIFKHCDYSVWPGLEPDPIQDSRVVSLIPLEDAKLYCLEFQRQSNLSFNCYAAARIFTMNFLPDSSSLRS